MKAEPGEYSVTVPVPVLVVVVVVVSVWAQAIDTAIVQARPSNIIFNFISLNRFPCAPCVLGFSNKLFRPKPRAYLRRRNEVTHVAKFTFPGVTFETLFGIGRSVAARGEVGNAYLELGMFDDAEQALEQIRGEDKWQKEVLHASLVISLAAENWDTAVAIAADLVKAEPKNPTT